MHSCSKTLLVSNHTLHGMEKYSLNTYDCWFVHVLWTGWLHVKSCWMILGWVCQPELLCTRPIAILKALVLHFSVNGTGCGDVTCSKAPLWRPATAPKALSYWWTWQVSHGWQSMLSLAQELLSTLSRGPPYMPSILPSLRIEVYILLTGGCKPINWPWKIRTTSWPPQALESAASSLQAWGSA